MNFSWTNLALLWPSIPSGISVKNSHFKADANLFSKSCVGTRMNHDGPSSDLEDST